VSRLTDRQREILDWIAGFARLNGCGPTVREIAEGVGIGSNNGVVCHLVALARKGYVRRRAGSPRGLTLVIAGPPAVNRSAGLVEMSGAAARWEMTPAEALALAEDLRRAAGAA
jgi:repressor LexA